MSWIKVLGDDPDSLVDCYSESFSKNETVFSTGGIGATPDDLTRHAAAKAFGTTIERHPEGVELLQIYANKTGKELTPERYRLVEFPKGSSLIPNPYNGIPGFSLDNHFFVPGFPEMAWPMFEWVLSNKLSNLSAEAFIESSVLAQSSNETIVIPLLERILQTHSGVKVFSLPIIGEPPQIELGVKGQPAFAKAALKDLKDGLDALGIEWLRGDLP